MWQNPEPPKTSASSPLRIAEVTPAQGPGRIGITLCPGKQGPSLRSSAAWHRDLASDLEVILRWGAEVVVTLVEDHELAELGVRHLGPAVGDAGLVWLHLPIVDGSPPDERFESMWSMHGPRVLATLADGGRVLVHCRGGLGRAGTVAARLLVESGSSPEEAIGAVRRARPGAIETESQRRYVLGLHESTVAADPERRCLLPTGSSIDRFTGCLLGGAVGDALGAPVEFWSIDRIRSEFGPGGVEDYAIAYGRAGAITDDTQMTLFTAEGLLDAVAAKATDVDAYVAAHHGACLRWLSTQEGGTAPGHAGTSASGSDSPRASGAAGLVDMPRLHSRRAPGVTCLSALRSGSIGTPHTPINDSKGCGGVMRMAPVGLLATTPGVGADGAVSDRVAFSLGTGCAAVTHGHPSGHLAAGALAQLIARLIADDPLEAAVRRIIRSLSDHPGGEECAAALHEAVALWRSERPVGPETLALLGEGWVAEEALAMSVYCSLAAGGDYRRGVLLAANHSGDSDSTAAITGNILGALKGRRSIPAGWIQRLELADVTEELATRLHDSIPTLPPIDGAARSV